MVAERESIIAVVNMATVASAASASEVANEEVSTTGDVR